MNTAYLRLLLMCAAYAAGETAAVEVGAYDVAMFVGLLLGAGAYLLTQDVDRPRRGGGRGRRGEIRYWRGRRIDDN